MCATIYPLRTFKTIMIKSRSQGFTLIELLVVIAIIGILSSVVLTSLGTARNKGNDASMQASMSSLRSAAEIYYSTNGVYYSGTTVGGCSAGFLDDDSTNAKTLYTQIKTLSGGAANVDCNLAAGGGSWAMSAKLPSNSTKFFCVDSTGVAGIRTQKVSSSTCPTS